MIFLWEHPRAHVFEIIFRRLNFLSFFRALTFFATKVCCSKDPVGFRFQKFSTLIFVDVFVFFSEASFIGGLSAGRDSGDCPGSLSAGLNVDTAKKSFTIASVQTTHLQTTLRLVVVQLPGQLLRMPLLLAVLLFPSSAPHCAINASVIIVVVR